MDHLCQVWRWLWIVIFSGRGTNSLMPWLWHFLLSLLKQPQQLDELIKIPKETIEILKNQVFGFDTFFVTSQEPYEVKLIFLLFRSSTVCFLGINEKCQLEGSKATTKCNMDVIFILIHGIFCFVLVVYVDRTGVFRCLFMSIIVISRKQWERCFQYDELVEISVYLL